MSDLIISLIQANLHWEERDANLAMFEEKIWNLEESDLIVLPEMFSTGFSMNSKKLAEPPGGKTFQWMRQMAKQKNAAIAGSYIIKERKDFYNRLYFVFPDGSSAQYDKKHLFALAGEDEDYTAGKEKLIVEYKGWKICPMICYDLRFPVWARSQRRENELYEYDLLLYVANWPEPRINAWDTLLKARGIENLCYSVGVNRVGKDGEDRNHPGHSGAYSFKGDELAFTAKEEELTMTLSKSELEEFRTKFPFQADADSFNL